MITDKATNIKTKLKLFINNIDELDSTFVTYRALLIKDLLQLTLNLVQDKEEECAKYKQALDEIRQYRVAEINDEDKEGNDTILSIIDKVEEQQ